MKSQPLGYPRRPDVSRYAAALLARDDDDDDDDDPFLIVREGNGGTGTGIPAHRTHARRMHYAWISTSILGSDLRSPILYR